MTLTAKDVAEITRLLEESNFDELSLELDGLKLTLRRNGAAAVHGAPAAATPVSQPSDSMAAPPAGRLEAGSSRGGPPAGAAPESAAAVDAAGAAAPLNITAPLLGTFYRAPKPGAPPFVEVGSAVEEDTIIGIIEVMKLMNTVRAGTSGRVVDILAQDGALVEYGETLMCVSKVERA